MSEALALCGGCRLLSVKLRSPLDLRLFVWMDSQSRGGILVDEICIAKKGSCEGGSHGASRKELRTLGQRILAAKCLLSISGLFSQDEIQSLKSESIIASNCDTRNVNQHTGDNEDISGRLVVRMPVLLSSVTAGNGTGKTGHLPDALPKSLSRHFESVIDRILNAIDDPNLVCPSVRLSIFGSGEGDIDGSQEVSVAALKSNDQLVFSTREPAVNVYHSPQGHFGMHKDGKALTILMPLSDTLQDFDGGGTAFWSEENPQLGRHDPSYVATPKAGTVLVFGGQVHHAGLHISSGTRVVLVASFSRRQPENLSL